MDTLYLSIRRLGSADHKTVVTMIFGDWKTMKAFLSINVVNTNISHMLEICHVLFYLGYQVSWLETFSCER